MAQSQQGRIFGKRPKEHTIIIASGDRVRHMTVRPWAMAVTGCLAAVLMVTFVAAAAYLVLRDDLIGSSVARQARMQHAYEDRIAALRAQVDRVTSRQLLDQQLMEEKVDRLIAHQDALSSRNGRLDALLRRAEHDVAPGAIDAPLPTPRPGVSAELRADTALDAISLVTGSIPATQGAGGNGSDTASAYAPSEEPKHHHPDRVFSEIESSLHAIEQEQLSRVRALTSDAYDTAKAIEDVLHAVGLNGPVSDTDGVGGPFIDAPANSTFEATLDDLDEALTRLDAMRSHAAALPFAHPAPGRKMSSRFGTRKDPFLGRTAFHAGIDFRIGSGEAVRASGGGTVVKAGRSGGYGNLVEIDHGDGLTTRYAHLSALDVSRGQLVAAGERIGLAGSTGRSTGPHLHYEVRRHGKPVDPQNFLGAGMSLKPLLAAL
ncbi:peptidoglycan DD-metalloendopeptidase family protein [Pararhizobium haloflavum]|uniref:peptidoglycan DD-metalloendopeptidase family protein n=1 Tax=Pararhizobium haloflavum TaxID=2037914 RepID=UPI00352296E6